MRTGMFITLLVVSAFNAIGANIKAAEVPTAAEILDAWSGRANNFKSGKISWTIPLQGWNIFGRFETYWVPDSTPVDQEMTGTLSFAGQSARYDSFSLSYADFGESSPRKSTEKAFYGSVLNSGFLIHNQEYRELLPYTVIFSPNKRLHYWHGNEKEYPRAIILPAVSEPGFSSLANLTRFNSDPQRALSGGPSTILHQLLAAPALLTFRPLLYDRGLEQADALLEVDEFRPTYEGRPCVVLRVKHGHEMPLNNKAEPTTDHQALKPSAERIYWVDPSRDFVVVRFIETKDHKPFLQMDISYDLVADTGWIPNKWTALQYGPRYNVVQKIATAERTGIDMGQPISDASMKISFPPGTGVIDALTERWYIVRDDLSEYEFSQGFFNDFDYATLVAASKMDMKWRKNQPTSTRWQTFAWLLKWPGSLIPMSLICVVLIYINGRLVRRRNSRSKSTDSQMDTY